MNTYDKNDYYFKRFEKCVQEDVPDKLVAEFILDSEKSHPKLKYEARPAKSGKPDHNDMWSYLKPGEEPQNLFFPYLNICAGS